MESIWRVLYSRANRSITADNSARLSFGGNAERGWQSDFIRADHTPAWRDFCVNVSMRRDWAQIRQLEAVTPRQWHKSAGLAPARHAGAGEIARRCGILGVSQWIATPRNSQIESAAGRRQIDIWHPAALGRVFSAACIARAEYGILDILQYCVTTAAQKALLAIPPELEPLRF